MSGIIYLTENRLNGKIYIGIHTRGDAKYLGSGVFLIRAIEKYGKENFFRITIDEFDSIDVGLAKEKYWIKELNSKHPNGYNLVDGGRGSFNPCEETREKIRNGRLGKPSGMLGKRQSKESRLKMSLAREGKPSNRLGATQTDEAKEKVRKAMTGRHPSEETRERLRLSHTGIPKSKETIEKLRNSAVKYWAKRNNG